LHSAGWFQNPPKQTIPEVKTSHLTPNYSNRAKTCKKTKKL